MLHYLKKYPLSLVITATIVYLSFFKPPQTDMNEIPYIDKVVHTCMYGGLCLFIWIEYLRSHKQLNPIRMIIGGIVLPIVFSGFIEYIQGQCTETRSGDWADLGANILGVLLAALVGHYILRPYFKAKA